jgi:hypothetical protein
MHFNIIIMSEYTEEQYEIIDQEIDMAIQEIDRIFPDAKFDICTSFHDKLDHLLTDKKQIFISNVKDCYCWDDINTPKQQFFEIKGEKLTYKYVLNELIRLNFNPECNHTFLESIDKVTDIQYRLWMGS